MVVYRQLHGMGLPEAPPNLSLLRHSPDSRDTTFRGASFLICAEKKYHNLKRSPPTFLGPPSFRGDPPAVSRVACMPSTTPTHTPECLAPYSLGVVGAQSCLGKLLFCLETPLPTSLYPLWSGTERCCGEVSQVPKLPFPQVPPLHIGCALNTSPGVVHRVALLHSIYKFFNIPASLISICQQSQMVSLTQKGSQPPAPCRHQWELSMEKRT